MLRDLRVLVADHDPAALQTVALALERLGALVVRAETGGELLERLVDEGPFDLIVTELDLRWMSGLQALYAVRHAGVTTPIIVTTTGDEQRITEVVRRMGDVVVLSKPFAPTLLESFATSLLQGFEDSVGSMPSRCI